VNLDEDLQYPNDTEKQDRLNLIRLVSCPSARQERPCHRTTGHKLAAAKVYTVKDVDTQSQHRT